MMGTSVMGIASMGEKRLSWPSANPIVWKLIVLFVGVPAAYFALLYLSLGVIALEFLVLLTLGLVLFRAPQAINVKADSSKSGTNSALKDIMNKLEHCCDD